MTEHDSWVKQTLSELRKLDRQAQRVRLEQLFSSSEPERWAALRRELAARRTRVEAELKGYQSRRQPDAARKMQQKAIMLARMNWLLHVMDLQDVSHGSTEAE